MKFYLSIIFLTLTFFLNVNAQDSEEISQLTPIRKPTKSELKKLKKLSSINVCPLGADIIDVSITVEPKILSNGKKVTVIKADFRSNSLFFKEIEKEQSLAAINVYGKITSIDEKLNGTFEEAINFVFTKEHKVKLETLLFKRIFELPEGKYKLTFAARDTQTGATGARVVKFEVN